jgi:hypothetical protein
MDNGPQFTSAEFEDFLAKKDIHHYRTSVYNPQENGLVEAFNKVLKYGVQAFQASGKSWEDGLRDLLTSYRAAPNETGQSPGERFLGRPFRPDSIPNRKKPMRRTTQEQQTQSAPIQQSSDRRDERIYTGKSVYSKGEKVLTKLPHVPKGASPWSQPKTVDRVLGAYTFLLSDGQVWNARKMKPWTRWTAPQEDGTYMDEPAPRTLRRSQRATKGQPPKRFTECIACASFGGR